ncbi:dipeptidase PepV [Natronincola ferrireducens]|uniref:Dipeptidase, putative n=1 Tax=Natronincola ferrireducens TaxID=393762 RepID=A0A1G8ZNI2_9FIRM|nr:dipeptidase PepV [Natronincola ferrireducens]SDK15710.1 dipeptidase, putative [Natronincola ferrireducens]
MDSLENKVQSLKDELVSSIQQLVQIKSVEAEALEKMPFGKGVNDALQFTLALGEKMGFSTVNKDGYYGYIEMGEGEELIGILGHLDVVPAEKPEAWTYPPFSGEIADNRIYGRGTLDDKGPLLAVLYGMKALKEADIPLNKRVRLILGTNEETHWKDINKYIEEEEIPTLGFTPDSDYPLINAEKGLLQVKLSIDEGTSFKFQGGTALNSVPESCSFTGEDLQSLIKTADDLNYQYIIQENTFTFLGKAAHSAKAWEGKNAIVQGALLLSKEKVTSSVIDFVAKEVGEDVYARRIFNNYCDNVSGNLTFNIAKVLIDENKQELYIDIRMPVTKEMKEVLELLKKSVKPYGLNMEVLDSLPSLYVPEDHYLVQTLRQVYEEVTNQNSTPLATGGATYARAFKNFVAFGPLFPGEEKMAHKANEYIDIDSLMKTTVIYAKAIVKLLQ